MGAIGGRAVKDNPDAAESLGVVVFNSKMGAAGSLGVLDRGRWQFSTRSLFPTSILKA